jgi:hypothetical protein
VKQSLSRPAAEGRARYRTEDRKMEGGESCLSILHLFYTCARLILHRVQLKLQFKISSNARTDRNEASAATVIRCRGCGTEKGNKSFGW